MTTRRSVPGDIDRIMQIYDTAREYMIKNGNPTQWSGGYPKRSMIEDDIKRGESFVVVDERGVIHGVFAFILGEDPTYAHIEGGKWLRGGPYGTIHRIAGDGGRGGVFACCLNYCRSVTGNIRIDTHRDNLKMQELLKKNGFVYCGIIYVYDGSARLAYQLA
jgi:hypothetical protein